MADTKITALAAITTVDPAADVLPIVDISDTSMAASGTTKKITSNQILGAGGTATLASATISGDLTVRTNRLATTTTGVGIGTASPSYDLQVNGSTNGRIQVEGASGFGMVFIQASSGNSAQLQLNSSGGSGRRFAVNSNSSGQLTISDETAASTRFAIDSTGVFTFQNVGGVAGTAMTLNATGLGVGVSPAYKGDFNGNIRSMKQGGRTDLAFLIDGNASPAWQQRNVLGHYYNGAQDCISLRVPSSATSNTGSYDIGADGTHSWYPAAGTTATGSTGTPTMTLDASGRLILLASTTTPATLSTNGQLTFTATSNTNLRFSYRGSDGVTRTADLTLA